MMDLLLGIFLSILASFFPTVAYAWFVWWLDRYEKEPWWLLVAVFAWGMIGAPIVTLFLEFLLDIPTSLLGPGLTYELVGASFVAPLVEETTKVFGVLVVFFFFQREFDSVLYGIIYGAMAGLGFAFTENIFYFIGSIAEGGWGVWIFVVFMRAIIFGLNHAFFTGLTGAGLALFRLADQWPVRLLALLGGLGMSIFFHAFHNFGATLASLNCFSLLISLAGYGGGLLILGVAIMLV
jgi:RsiW-degrading membrane proteinase PrsW (M82 family)